MDTPGIGDVDQNEVAGRMMDYLPNALAFVFVVNVAAGGGLHKDRVITIMCFIQFQKSKIWLCIFLTLIYS